jgi:hypothetical protein
LKQVLLGALAIAAALAAGCARSSGPLPVQTSRTTPSPLPTIADPLNGSGASPANLRHRIAAVMIDNFPDARPQSGLHDADVVYEVEAEGGITRYLALFLGSAAAEVGPVRSTRTYFVDLARPYDPFFAHAGQNDDVIDVLKGLRASGFADMDQIQHTPEAFWRDDARDMPHNLYASVVKIREVGPKYGYADTPFRARGFEFDDDRADPGSAALGGAPTSSASADALLSPAALPTSPPLVPEVVLSFWQDYDVHFVWDGVAYQRFIDGQAQHDRDDDRPYEVSDIVVVWVPATVLDAIGDLRMDVYGSFPALLIHQGRVASGSWNASGPGTLPSLVGANGSTLPLTRGQIYIEVMPQGSSVKIGKQTWSH